MSDNKELAPIEQRQVVFYEDEITAVIVDSDGQREVYVPIRPICDYLGVGWTGQYERLQRDAVLFDVTATVRVTRTEGNREVAREMLCLSLDYLNGWLFGINANRVKPEVRDKVLRYQRGCYRVLAEAFRDGRLTVNSDGETDFETQLKTADPNAVEAYNTALAIMKLAKSHIMLQGRIDSHERQLRFHDARLEDVEEAFERLEDVESALGLLGDDPVISEAQASQISQGVKAVAVVLGKRSGRNEFGGVYGQLYRRYSVSGYKMLPAQQFKDAMVWLAEWLAELNE